jgi:hypothetical protein
MNNTYSDEEMKRISSKVIGYLESWQVSAEEILFILGVSEIKPRHLPRYRKMEKAFEQTEEVMQRIDHIVGIADALRTTFPHSDTMRLRWLRQPHRRFRKKTPLAVILGAGMNGLLRVRVEVDCAYGYAINDAMAAAAAMNAK